MELDKLIRTSDFITLNISLNSETKNFLDGGENKFDKERSGSDKPKSNGTYKL